MRFTLLFSIFLFCVSLNAQSGEPLKSIINKNNVAIRSLQKGIPIDNVVAVNDFKYILLNQQNAVKNYSSNKIISNYLAFKVRNSCVELLKKYSKGSTTYFELTQAEKSIAVIDKPNNLDENSASEIKSVEILDLKNPQSLNALTLTIQ